MQTPARPQGRIHALDTHPHPYVTPAELAAYWGVSRRYVYAQIEAGLLRAVRLGPRVVRIRTQDALRFERNAAFTPAGDTAPPPSSRKGEDARPLKAGESAAPPLSRNKRPKA